MYTNAINAILNVLSAQNQPITVQFASLLENMNLSFITTSASLYAQKITLPTMIAINVTHVTLFVLTAQDQLIIVPLARHQAKINPSS